MDKIAVIDFGGQYAHLIGNRVRRLGVYSEIFSNDVPADLLRDDSFKGIILSGGPQSVYEKNAPMCDAELFALGKPILGICYGHQLMTHLLGGKVSAGKVKEYGLANLRVEIFKGIFSGFSDKVTEVWMSHGDEVVSLPKGFSVMAKTDVGEKAAIGDMDRKFFGVQFHVEVTHTVRGSDMLANFLDICETSRDWGMEKFLERELSLVKEKAGKNKVFFLVSGGVDSTVAFTLLNKALGEKRMYGLFVDTGFMRKDEGTQVARSLASLGYRNFHSVDASAEFYGALGEIADPEEKRKAIGAVFLQIQRNMVRSLGLNPKEWLLGQGTIYPDTIESGGTKNADKIKTHHNRVPEIQKMIDEGMVMEPLKELYKDEVREVGEKLGLPPELVWRHPFPGPGLAVRCLCVDDKFGKRPDDVSRMDEEKKINAFLAKKGWKARVLPVLSVGVQGDSRTYRHPLVIFGRSASFDELEILSTELTNRFFGINRVLLLVSPDRVESIEMEYPAYVTKERIDFLREADATVSGFLIEKKLNRKIWQFPVCLLPLKINGNGNESIVLRPVCSEEAMTANFYKMSEKNLSELVKRLTSLDPPSAIFYDITNKPPGTIEWE